ncbi:MAG TPA: hypothetical protein VFR67_00835 [Pilimelia sp.]|nr:hypothetical protein [Pilimelia sp.]
MSDQYPPPYSGGQQYGAPPPHGGQQYGSPSPGGQQYGGGQYGGQQYGSPPPSDHQYGGGQQYGASQPGQPYAVGQPGGQPGGRPYGNPPPAQFAAPVTTAPRKKPLGKKLAGFAGVIVAVVVVALLKFGVFAGLSSALGVGDDKTAEAKAGDCLAQLPTVGQGQEKEANNAKVVKCDAADAKFSVVGRVENQTQAQAANDGVCKAYPEAEYRFSSIPQGGKGYVLCLKELKPTKTS